jgi:holliday junction DNA helicase RuvA
VISSLRGVVAFRSNETIVLEVGGVGLDVLTSRSALDVCEVGEMAAIVTRLIVREDALTLYGFSSIPERELFDVLLKINGVGPKMAMAIISTLSIDNLRNAVATQRAELLTRVPGVGKKTAEKIMLELKDKLPMGLDAVPQGGFDDINSDVMDALVSLGFSVVEAQMAIQSLPADTPQDMQERIRLSLQYLSD